MSITPYSDLKTQDILSAHLSGVQRSINNIETVLNMKTLVVTGHTLTPVTDQDDASLRYLIYEGTIRNWLGSPSPVIKRGGVVVDPSEYTLYQAYGAIVFAVQQASSAVITADVTYITNDSQVIDDLQTNVSANASAIAVIPKIMSLTSIQSKSTWMTNMKTGGGMNTSPSTSVTQVTNAIDCFPFWVNSQMTFDKLKVTASKDTIATNCILGIYRDSGGFPGSLVFSTPSFAVAAGDTVSSVDYVQAFSDLVLQPGLYWLARYQTSAAKFDGINVATPSLVIDIADPDDVTLINGSFTLNCCGTRSGNIGTVSTLPSTHPVLSSTNQYLKRSSIGIVWAHRKA